MTCRACTEPAKRRGLCLGHALMFLWGPWLSVEEFLLRGRG